MLRKRVGMRKLWHRILVITVVFSMLLSNVTFFTLAEQHQHIEDCYENVIICGQNESAPQYISTFTTHHHTDSCKDEKGNIVCGYEEGTYYHQHNDFCRDAEGNLFCGLDTKRLHVHTEGCYKTDQVLICTNEDPGHKHTADCVKTTTTLTCEIPESDGHHHGDDCYTRVVTITCGMEETPAHFHDDSCYTVTSNYNCGLEEGAGAHTHTDSCYEVVMELHCEEDHEHTDSCYVPGRTLTCTKDHEHTDACYEIKRKLICGQEENPGHIHGDSCVETIRTLTCGKEETPGHQHTETCETVKYVLTCTTPESDGHHHSDSCYTTTSEYICGEEERKAHKHTDECYEEVTTLACKLPTEKHTHSAACFDKDGHATCGKVEIPTFTSSAANWTEGHTHTADCYERVLVCGLSETVEEEDAPNVPFKENEKEENNQESPETIETPGEDNAEAETNPEDEQSESEKEENPCEENSSENEESTENEDNFNDKENSGEEASEDDVNPETMENSKGERKSEDEENTEDKENTEHEENSEDKENPENEEISEDEENPGEDEISEDEEDLGDEENLDEEAEITEEEEIQTEYIQLEVELLGNSNILLSTLLSNLLPELVENLKINEILEITWDGGVSVTKIYTEDSEQEELRDYQILATDTAVVTMTTETSEIEISISVTGSEVYQSGNLKIYSVDGFYLPEEAEGSAEKIISPDKEIEKVETAEEQGSVERVDPEASLLETTLTVSRADRAQKQSVSTQNLLINNELNLETDSLKTEKITEEERNTDAQKENSNTDTNLDKEQDEEGTPNGLISQSTLNKTFYQVYDISLEKVNPKDYPSGFQVELTLENEIRGSDIHLYHIHEDVVSEIDYDLNGTTLKFVTPNFSSFVLSYTVDFYYGAYDFHLNGNGEILLSDLLTALRIEADLTGSNAIFTNPSLLVLEPQFAKKGGDNEKKDTVLDDAEDMKILMDWLISSLAPFDTEETLTIVLHNGEQIILTVTDKQIINYHQTREGDTYKVTVEYDEDAGIPDEAELTIEEAKPELYIAEAATALGAKDASYLLYTKFLNISFIIMDEEGHQEEIEPVGPISVSIELMDVTDGVDALQVIHFDENEPEIISSTVTKNAVVNFYSDAFSVFGIGNVLEKIAAAETEEVDIEILGFSAEAEIASVDAPVVEEGLEVLGVYSLNESDNKMWIRADMKDGVELSSIESVVIYGVNEENQNNDASEDQTCEQAEEQNHNIQLFELATAGTVAELTVSEFALVKDSGYRHLSFEINVSEEEVQAGEEDTEAQEEHNEANGKIILDGLMPRMATAKATDVTDLFADHAYVVSEEIVDEIAPEMLVSNEANEDTEDHMPENGCDGKEMQKNAEEKMKRTTLAAFNITIFNDESEYQPDEQHPITVEICDNRIVAGENIELWHIMDDGTEERIQAFTVEERKIEFTAIGFSAYAIVIKEMTPDNTWEQLTPENYFAYATRGIFIGSAISNYYFTSELLTTNGKSVPDELPINYTQRVGIKKTDDKTDVGRYYLEGTTTESVKIYCLENGVRKYLRRGKQNGLLTDNSISFVNSAGEATEFTIDYYESEKNSGFRIRDKNSTYYVNMQGGTGGKIFASFNNNDGKDTNNLMRFWYHKPTVNDPYELDGQTYGLMHWNGGIAGKGLMATSTYANKLDAKAMEVLSKKNGDVVERLYVPSDSDISMWTFQCVANNTYRISTNINGTTNYLVIDANGASLTPLNDVASIIQIVSGGGAQENQICLKSNDYTLTYSGSIKGGFTNTGNVGNEWFYLVDYSELTSDYLVTYSAQKVSVSDSTVTVGSRVIVYTRTWNDTLKKYEFYAVDQDGGLVECFESGDTIQWIGNRINSLLWDFTEYYWEGTADPNYYYELYNEYSEKYIAPQIAGNQILSSRTIGLNMPGRRNGAYHSTILAWDELHQAFVGLKAADNNTTIESCDIDEAGSFYFAIVQNANVEDVTNTVETVDNNLYGIKMKLVDCEQPSMNNLMGSNGDETGLLSTSLNANGYPATMKTNSSLGELYSSAKDVNHLFIESTYYASGYFEYDSTQNFASLKGATGGNFTVYQELGTQDVDEKITLKHGQFFPYNDIQAGLFAVRNPQNLYSALANPSNQTQGLLSDDNPRKYEKLYLVNNPNFYFAMEMEASFVQTPSGLDAWGHDIIYEFTGDDDFWLYVDGELVIDLGGIHSAQWGKVNFRTGAVTGSKGNKDTTLRTIFETNYRTRNPEASDADVSNYLAQYFNEGEAWFKDYTTHSMKIFYMERGAGASNLHMRFNLASVKEGTIELSKKLSGISSTESLLAEFPYQIWYKKSEDAIEKQLTQNTKINDDDDMTISVKYKDTDKDVSYQSIITIDGITYNDVFMLKPDETAVIELPDDGIYYRIVECGVNKDIYSDVITREEIPVTETLGSGYPGNRADYGIEYAMTRSRTRVTYINTVDQAALRTLEITKKLYDVTGENEVHNDNTTFNFRLYLDYEYNDTTTLANMFVYHVKDQAGNYCYWNVEEQDFMAIEGEDGQGVRDYTLLNETQQKQSSFNTSIYGSISHIPVDYTVEIRELLIGTKYKVEERINEIPDGYSIQKYELCLVKDDNTKTAVMLADNTAPVSGTIEKGIDPHVYVCNIQGYGIRMYKSWLDEDYMDSRSSAYFAVYTKDESENLNLVSGTIKELKDRNYTLYWLFQELNGINFENYIIREVNLTNPIVDSEGHVTSCDSITPVDPGGTIYIQGTQKGESSASLQEYKVMYNQGSLTGENNVRLDYVTNSRSGIVIRKEDFEGNPLDDSTFMLVDESGDLHATYTSDSTGYITTVFLRTGVTYTLTETKARTGYQGLDAPITITKNSDGTISVSGIDSMYYDLKNNNGVDEPILTIKNKAITFKIRKQDSVTGQYLAGVHFSLYRQVTVGGVTLIDFNPMTGYEDLVTGEDGIIPGINQTLSAGAYELREIMASPGYEVLSSGIEFTLDEIGTITLGRKHPADTILERQDSEDGKRIFYTMRIPNSVNSTLVDLTITKTVKGDIGDRSQNFTFTLESVTDEVAGTEYGYTITKVDGTSASWYLTTKNGQNEFHLAHGETLVIYVPIGKSVVIREDNGYYTTDWELDGTTLISDSNNKVEFNLTEAGTLTVTNTLNAVAPTGFNTRHTIFLLLLLFGLIMLICDGMITKMRRGGQLPTT